MTGKKYSLLAKFEFARRWSATDQSRFSISPTCSILSLQFVLSFKIGDILPHKFADDLRRWTVLLAANLDKPVTQVTFDTNSKP
nr:hypothetical protein [Rhodothalassium salexigens]